MCLLSGLVGAGACASLATVGIPGPDGPFTYPTALPDHTLLQMVLAAAQVGLVVGLLTLGRSAVPTSGPARLGLRVAVAALAGLLVAEGVAISDPVTPADATPPAFGLVHGGYGLVLGLGLLVVGAGLTREGSWVGWRRWLPTLLGAWLFVPGLPALLAGHAAASWSRAGWFALFALLGLVLARSGPAGDPAVAPATGSRAARGYATVTWVYVAAFGSPAVPVTAYLLQNDRLPSFFDLFRTFGGERVEQLDRAPHVLLILGYLGVTLLAGWAAWLVRRGSRGGAALALGVMAVEAVFWVVFAMPIPWVLAVIRLVLLALAWPALGRGVRPAEDESTVGPRAVHPVSKDSRP